VPCTDAIALLVYAIASNMLWFALPLLLSFSVGLALVLIAIGMAVVYAKNLGAKQWQEKRWFRALPIISAILIIAIGFGLCQHAVRS
jgi:ABC-type nickel/cobalt efflux system permease component RcnA